MQVVYKKLADGKTAALVGTRRVAVLHKQAGSDCWRIEWRGGGVSLACSLTAAHDVLRSVIGRR